MLKGVRNSEKTVGEGVYTRNNDVVVGPPAFTYPEFRGEVMVLLFAVEPALAFAAGWALLTALRLGQEKRGGVVPARRYTRVDLG